MLSHFYVTLIVALVTMLFSVESFHLMNPSIKYSTFQPYSSEIDPNFEEHLPLMLKVGLQERPDEDMASQLRKKHLKSQEAKRSAARVLKSTNAELAAELEEIAAELEESQERFVKAALLRMNEHKDPNDEQVDNFPSELLLFRQRADVKRRAAKELRDSNLSPALAEELDDLASEMEETHKYFDKISKSLHSKFNPSK